MENNIFCFHNCQYTKPSQYQQCFNFHLKTILNRNYRLWQRFTRENLTWCFCAVKYYSRRSFWKTSSLWRVQAHWADLGRMRCFAVALALTWIFSRSPSSTGRANETKAVCTTAAFILGPRENTRTYTSHVRKRNRSFGTLGCVCKVWTIWNVDVY